MTSIYTDTMRQKFSNDLSKINIGRMGMKGDRAGSLSHLGPGGAIHVVGGFLRLIQEDPFAENTG